MTFESIAPAVFGLIGAVIGVFGSLAGVLLSTRTAREQARLAQRTVIRSEKKESVVAYLRTLQNFTYILIDDLDRDWVDESILNTLIRCLFRTVLDLRRVRNLKVLVALRTNLFEQLNFGSRTGGQEEKFRSMSLHVRWTKVELENLLSVRARAAAERHQNGQISKIKDLLPASNKTRGNALDFMLQRTLLRPRDAIAYFNESLSRAGGKQRLTWTEIQDSERSYSVNRLLALRDEWKPTYPDIEKLLRLFQSAPASIGRQYMTSRLDDAVLLLADPNFTGGLWMTRLAERVLNSADGDLWAETYQPLLVFLYNIGFIGCVQLGHTKVTYAYDQPDLFDQLSKLEAIESFAVHLAFRSALDIQSVR